MTGDDNSRRAESDAEEQVERLVEQKWDSVRDYVRARWRRDLVRKASPTDIVQSVCRRALLAARRFRPNGPRAALAWLRKIADNTMREKHRALTAERRDVDQEQRIDTSSDGPRAAFVDDPLDAAIAGEQEDRLRAAIARLPDEQRAVMTLRRLDGLEREAVAERLGKSPDAVDALLRRARVQLSRELSEAGWA